MEDATKGYITSSDDESFYCCNVESSNSSDDESFYCCNVSSSNSSDDESFSSLDVDVDVSSSSNLAVSFAEFYFSERMDSSHLECSSGEKIATDETPSRPLENISNVEGVFSERKNVSKSSDGEFCSEEKTAGNETTSSIELISDEEPSSETNVVKLASEEKTFSETPRFSIDIGFDVPGVFSERNNVSKLSSDDEFCSEQKTAGNETLSSSTEVISGEEPSSGENVVKLPSEENTVSETSKISTEIASNVEETPSESSIVESPDPVQKGRESFEHLDFKIEITEDLISSLMKRFKENQYIPSSAYGEDCDISSTCIYLFKKSYKCEVNAIFFISAFLNHLKLNM
ncbi:dentin sialophosphoprotein-like [Stegodyphus dumicola]|uniref:dentin sialophosphoprotein-like n=1 Tax=Stegodyphus dumicola TaxID=202533 RepID=UPI0015B36AAB|nr:dentin sialophosphoprotein-like [Stegodyphus dumicola]